MSEALVLMLPDMSPEKNKKKQQHQRNNNLRKYPQWLRLKKI
jgi:hypothetical protein